MLQHLKAGRKTSIKNGINSQTISNTFFTLTSGVEDGHLLLLGPDEQPDLGLKQGNSWP